MAQKEEKLNVISDKTKVVLAIPQLVAVIAFILAVSGGFVGIGSEVSEVDKRSKNNQERIEAVEIKQQSDREEWIKLVHEVRESQIRIEEALKLKQDKKWID